MYAKISLISLLLCCSLLLQAGETGSENNHKNSSKPEKTTQAIKQSKPVIIGEGKRTFNIELPANPSTGYQWVLHSDYDTRLIKAKGYRYMADDNGSKDKKLVGQPGKVEFKFEARNRFKKVPQILKLHFSYIRLWDPKDNPKQHTVVVVSTPQ